MERMDYDIGPEETAEDNQVSGASIRNLAAKGVIGPPSLRNNLKSQLRQAEAEVKRITELIDLMERNPDNQRIFELMNKHY